MVITPFTAVGTAVGTASAVLALSKAAWKIGISLSKLDQDTRIVDTAVENLAGELKSLGNECDLVYFELEEVASKSEKEPPTPSPYDGRVWDCLAAQVEETSWTIQELELFVKSVRGEESSFISQAQRQRKLDQSKDQIAGIRTKICRNTNNLRITLLLIKTILAHIVPSRAGQADSGLAKELEKLQYIVENMHNSQSQTSHADTALMQCVREVIVKGRAICEASLASQLVTGGQGGHGVASRNIRVAEWVSTLESIRRDQRCSVPPSDSPKTISTVPATSYKDEVIDLRRDTIGNVSGDDSDDDLDTDLAKAALATGTTAFNAQEWEEADSLLQEALRGLEQLSKQRRAFCDLFDLQYKLAVCAYHTQEPADAEEALMSLVLIQQSVNSDKQRGSLYDAAHLLSYVYIRIGQVERARSECEKALQGRRRLLGKRSDAALESTALMAHIYVLLKNPARSKSCLAMIPEVRRDAVVQIVEESLGIKAEHFDSSSPSLHTRSISEAGDSDLAVTHVYSRLSASSPAPSAPPASPALPVPREAHFYGPVSTMIAQSPAASLRKPHQRVPSYHTTFEEPPSKDLQSVVMPYPPSATERSSLRATEKERVHESFSAALSPYELPEQDASENFKGKALSRKEILNKIGCQPKDRIEEAVCDSDHVAFAGLLNRKKDFWRSKLRKRVRPERVTALHFAALFGEIEMAQRLLASNFNVNEVPYGYTTPLTPLKFAIGARQAEMVKFLIANGAKPSEPDSWATLAGQLMNRSWLTKTLSEAEKEDIPDGIIAILKILLQHGWDMNAPIEASGRTVLHQAVTLWTGSYTRDLNLRATVTSFLCERGADPFQANTEGKTAYDMASASGHQDLLLVLDRGEMKNDPYHWSAEPVELSSEP